MKNHELGLIDVQWEFIELYPHVDVIKFFDDKGGVKQRVCWAEGSGKGCIVCIWNYFEQIWSIAYVIDVN